MSLYLQQRLRRHRGLLSRHPRLLLSRWRSGSVSRQTLMSAHRLADCFRFSRTCLPPEFFHSPSMCDNLVLKATRKKAVTLEQLTAIAARLLTPQQLAEDVFPAEERTAPPPLYIPVVPPAEAGWEVLSPPPPTSHPPTRPRAQRKAATGKRRFLFEREFGMYYLSVDSRRRRRRRSGTGGRRARKSDR